MALLRNDAPGARAVLLQDRSYLLVDAGETVEVCDDAIVSVADGLARLDRPKPKGRSEDGKRAIVEAMSDDDLRAFVARVTGKAPHPRAGRETLIARALGGE